VLIANTRSDHVAVFRGVKASSRNGSSAGTRFAPSDLPSCSPSSVETVPCEGGQCATRFPSPPCRVDGLELVFADAPPPVVTLEHRGLATPARSVELHPDGARLIPELHTELARFGRAPLNGTWALTASDGAVPAATLEINRAPCHLLDPDPAVPCTPAGEAWGLAQTLDATPVDLDVSEGSVVVWVAGPDRGGFAAGEVLTVTVEHLAGDTAYVALVPIGASRPLVEREVSASSPSTSVVAAVAEALGGRLFGVRVSTSGVATVRLRR